MKRVLWQRVLWILCSLFVLAMAAGCKSNGPAIAEPTATKSALEITLQNAKLGVSQPLGILIKNAGSTNVYALDGQASCTILQIQRYDEQKKKWGAIGRCRDVLPPTVLVIRAGMSESFTLSPGSAVDPNAWAPGIYRIAVSFSTHPDGKSGAQVAYSHGFTIK